MYGGNQKGGFAKKGSEMTKEETIEGLYASLLEYFSKLQIQHAMQQVESGPTYLVAEFQNCCIH